MIRDMVGRISLKLSGISMHYNEIIFTYKSSLLDTLE